MGRGSFGKERGKSSMKTKHAIKQIKKEGISYRLLTLPCNPVTYKKPFLKLPTQSGILNILAGSKTVGFFTCYQKRTLQALQRYRFSKRLIYKGVRCYGSVTPPALHGVTGGLLPKPVEGGSSAREVSGAYKKRLTTSSVKPYPSLTPAKSGVRIRNLSNTKPHQHRHNTVLFLCISFASLWRTVWGSPWAGRFPWFPVLRTLYCLPPFNRFATVGVSFQINQGSHHYA